MPIPAFEQGLLPVGVHECTMDELKTRFGSFQASDRRPHLFGKLQEFVVEVKRSGFVRHLVIDGSFVTSRADPQDIDLIIVVVSNHDISADLSPGQYNLVSKKRVRDRLGFDIIAVRENTREYEEAVAFFQQVRGEPARQKGLLRVTV